MSFKTLEIRMAAVSVDKVMEKGTGDILGDF